MSDRERDSDADVWQDRRVLESLPVAVGWTSGRETDSFEYVNDAMVELFDAPSEAALVGRAVTDRFVDPEDRRDIDDRLAEDGDVDGVEVEFETLTGERFWGEVTAKVDETRGGPRTLVTVRDVTDRREREVSLRLKARALEAAPFGVTLSDASRADNPLIYANEQFRQLTGYPSEDVLGRNCRFLQGENTGAEPVERMREAVDAEDPVTVDLRNYRKDGSEFWNRVTIAPVKDDAGTLTNYVGFQRDVTDHKEYERVLERYKELVENVPVGIYRNTPGPNGEFLEVNPAMVEMFDAESESELLDCRVDELYADPEQRERFATELAEEGLVVAEELRLQTLSGEPFWGEVTALATETDAGTYFDGAIADITTRKAYEQRLEQQRDDLEVLNRMVRHDIRNDLQIVLGRLDLVAEHVDDEGRDHVETALDRARSAVELTRTARKLADVMRQTETDRDRVALEPVLEEQVDELRTSFPDATASVDGAVPQVSVVGNKMLHSVFRNLLRNAVQHNDKDTPAVTVSVTEHGEDVAVRVADNGPGVPDARRETVFGKGEKGLDSDGTGVGLYLVQTLVDHYGGDVRVEDNDPVGAVFVVTLPKHARDG